MIGECQPGEENRSSAYRNEDGQGQREDVGFRQALVLLLENFSGEVSRVAFFHEWVVDVGHVSEIADLVDEVLLGGERRLVVDRYEDVLRLDVQMNEILRMDEGQAVSDVQQYRSQRLLVHVALPMVIVTYAFRKIAS